ncbi:DUF998 domain-containing protein [Actinoplanes sp. NPDC051513]|uniref:DUF998 domain-containing protein n=1 Tax=Actinoplanes sp. NPDC051513 TaxID=3363908 RepID=UPI0037A19FB9
MTAVASFAAVPASTTRTRSLLLAGAVAAPLWAAVSLVQAFTRNGFDITRHPLSMLSTGSLGWLQIANFLIAGALMVAGAAGLREVVDSRWAPRLLAVSGLGMVAAGVFTMDPADGFPAGTPAGPGVLSWHSFAHFASGTIAFGTLIAGCYVLARCFARSGDRRRALASAAAGTALLLGNGWAMSGGRAGSLTLAVGAISAMLWVSAVCAQRRR